MGIRSWSNCAIYAAAQYLRHLTIERRLHKDDPHRPIRRAYILLRRSDWGNFPHILYGQLYANGRMRLVSYKPRSPKKRAFPPPLFKGVLQWGDSIRAVDGGSVDDTTQP